LTEIVYWPWIWEVLLLARYTVRKEFAVLNHNVHCYSNIWQLCNKKFQYGFCFMILPLVNRTGYMGIILLRWRGGVWVLFTMTADINLGPIAIYIHFFSCTRFFASLLVRGTFTFFTFTFRGLALCLHGSAFITWWQPSKMHDHWHPPYQVP